MADQQQQQQQEAAAPVTITVDDPAAIQAAVFQQEGARLRNDRAYKKVKKQGLVRHVSDMGNTQMPEYGNCATCKRVGMLMQQCAACAIYLPSDQLDSCTFVPWWTKSHCFINPRLFARVFEQPAVAQITPAQYQVRVQGDRTFDPQARLPLFCPILAEDVAGNLIAQFAQKQGRTKRRPQDHFLQHLAREEWDEVYKTYRKNADDLGHPVEILRIDFVPHLFHQG